MSDQDRPIRDRDLQGGQDPDEPETRPADDEGPAATPMGQTDREQDAAGDDRPGA